MTAVEYKDYYTEGYKTDVERLIITEDSVSFFKNGEEQTGRYTYDGFEILEYEAGNRGTKRILPVFQGGVGADDPTTAADVGNGALMQQGFTLLWMGWQWDVPTGRMRMAIPIATASP